MNTPSKAGWAGAGGAAAAAETAGEAAGAAPWERPATPDAGDGPAWPGVKEDKYPWIEVEVVAEGTEQPQASRKNGD